MSAGTIRTRGPRRRWRVMPATAVLAGAGLGLMGPAPHAAALGALRLAASGPVAGKSAPVTAYVANAGSGTVTPIATATNTAGRPITTGNDPLAIAITPDGKTAYVANAASGTVTPITTATNTAGGRSRPEVPWRSRSRRTAKPPTSSTAPRAR